MRVERLKWQPVCGCVPSTRLPASRLENTKPPLFKRHRPDLPAALGGPHAVRHWLLVAPAFVVVCYQLGRGLGNTSYLLYWIAAVVLLLRGRDLRFPALPSFIFLGLLAWGTLSASLSINPDMAYRKWAQYALLGSSYFIVWRMVRSVEGFSIERALGMIGVAGVVSFAYFAARFLYLSGSPDFRPEVQLNGLVTAYLAPFVLYLLWRGCEGGCALILGVAYLMSLALLLVFSNSLTEVLALAAALAALAIVAIPSKRMLLLALGVAAPLFLVLIVLFDPSAQALFRAAGTGRDWFTILNELSSYRWQIWQQALATPPANPWLGVGPGNVESYPPVVVSETIKVRHLHNLLLDTWYEIGLVGLALYLLFYVTQARAAAAAGGNHPAPVRAVIYASIAAIVVAAMLEQSYRSFHAAMFLPFLFALYSRS